MKMAVATVERGESRTIPQTPWPEVQPPPSRAPKPTNNPAITTITQLSGIRGVGRAWPRNPLANGARISPRTKANCQTLSPAARVRHPPRMPLMPAIRPVAIINSAEASPISAPPSRAEIGSNEDMLLSLKVVLSVVSCFKIPKRSHRSQILIRPDVRFGSKADMCSAKVDVRFTPESGHVRRRNKCRPHRGPLPTSPFDVRLPRLRPLQMRRS